jgi:hypothetical protein
MAEPLAVAMGAPMMQASVRNAVRPIFSAEVRTGRGNNSVVRKSSQGNEKVVRNMARVEMSAAAAGGHAAHAGLFTRAAVAQDP